MESTYVTLSRQSGLLAEMRLVANNIANADTTGYRQQGLVFSEFVKDVGSGPSVSMARAQALNTSMQQGALTQTNATFDFAIEGEGFFLLETPAGNRLTRAGSFAPNAEGDLVSPDGHRVLDANGAPIFIPPDAATVDMGHDGSLSAGGQPFAQIGIYRPVDPIGLTREGGAVFRADGGIEPVEAPKVVQGFLENSNVNAIEQISRLVEIQRAYELGQSFLESEDNRVRTALKTLMR